MPSATVKAEPISINENDDPLLKLGLAIEKRVRNLEKRKTKLENYRSDLQKGKKLNADQQRAVDAYGAVQGSIEVCHEFTSMVEALMEQRAKDLKIQQKKQQEEREQLELDRIKQILKFQAVLSKLSNKAVKDDFLTGSNGALRLPKEKLSALEETGKLISPLPKDDRDFVLNNLKTGTSSPAEHLIALLDGKIQPMSSGGSSYKDMRTLLNQISNCSYPKRSKKPSPRESKNASPVERSGPKEQTAKSKKSVNKPNSKVKPGLQSEEKTSLENSSIAKSQVTSSSLASSSNAPTGDATAASSVTKEQQQQQELRRRELQNNNETTVPAVSSTKSLTTATPPPPGIPLSISARENMDSLTKQQSFNSSSSFFTSSTTTGGNVDDSKNQVDIRDLMSTPAGGLNFLQDSQVGASAVYVDPAVVSFGSVKPDGLIQMHEEQQRRLGITAPQSRGAPRIDAAVAVSDAPSSSIRSETFVNSTFSAPSLSSVPTATASPFIPSQQQQRQQTVPPHAQYQQQQQHPVPTPVSHQPPTSLPPPAIHQRLQQQQQHPQPPKPAAAAPSYSDHQPPPAVDSSRTTPSVAVSQPPPSMGRVSTSWASEEDHDGWGTPDPHSDSVVTGSWDEFCAASADSDRHSKPPSSVSAKEGNFNNGRHGGPGSFRTRLGGRGHSGSNFNSQRGEFRGGNRCNYSNFGNRLGGNVGGGGGYRGGSSRGLLNGGGQSGYRGGRGSGYPNKGPRGGSENGGRGSAGGFRNNRNSNGFNQSNSMQRNAY